MRKFYSLLLMLLVSVGAWAQTVVARMTDLVDGAATNTATVSSDWVSSEPGGAVYSFSNGTYIGGIANPAVLDAVNGDQYLIIAAWVYGRATGCIFGYGDYTDGFKFQQDGAGLKSTTKGVVDMGSVSANDATNYVQANQWNFVALAIPASQNAATQGKYYTKVGDTQGSWTRSVTLSNMNAPSAESQLFAIGSGDQGSAREAYSGLIANVTILTQSTLPSNAGEIANVVGAAPTITVTGAKAALQNRVNEIKPLIGDNPGFYSSENVSGPITIAENLIASSSSTVDELKGQLNTLNALSINMPISNKQYLLISANPAFEANQGVKKAMYAETGQNTNVTRWGTLNLADDKFKWTFTPNVSSGYDVENVGTTAKMIAWADNRQPLGDNAANITLASLGQGQFNIKNGSSIMHTEGHGDGTGDSNVIVSWGGGVNTSSAWYIIDVENIATITYQIKDGGDVVWSQDFVTYKGGDYPIPSLGWISVFYDVDVPTGTVSENQVVELTTTPKIKTFADANNVGQWYALDIHGNEAKYPLYHNADNLRVEYKGYTNADEYTRGAVKSDDYLWAFIGNPFTGVKLYNKSSHLYATQTSDADQEITLSAEGTVFKVHSSAHASLKETAFALKADGRSYYFNHRGDKVQGWTAPDAGSSLRAWPATVTSASLTKTLKAEYGTLAIPFYSRIPSGLEIYTCSSVSAENVVVLTPVTDWVRPNTAYIVKGVAGDSYEFTNTTKDSSLDPVTTGLLTGVLVNTTVPTDSYVLAKKGEKVGFFKVASGADVTCDANKCYLTVPDSPARALFFDAEDVETGINAVAIEEAVPANAAIYDLSGRRVQSAKSGLYIVNGKKVIK